MLNTVITHATGDVYPASDWNTYNRDNMNAYQVGRITVSALSGGPPATPGDTDIWIATGIGTDSRRWSFQYDAAEATANKWKFIGGDPVYSIGSTAIPGTSVWTTLLSFTPGRAGVYEVTGGFYGTNGGGGNAIQAGVGVAGAIVGATAKVGSIGAAADFTLNGVPFEVTITAGQAINLMGLASAANTVAFESLAIIPVRII